MINRTKVKESTQIKPGDNGDVLVMKDNAPEWSTPSDADLAKVSDTDAKLAEKQDKLTAGDNIKIEDNVISAAPKPTPINIGTVTEGDTAMVSNSGTDTDVVLNFVLPRGEKGDPGKDGTQVNTLSTPNTTGVLDFGENSGSLFYGYHMDGNPLTIPVGNEYVGIGRIPNDEITSDNPLTVDGGIVVTPGAGGVVVGRGVPSDNIIIGEPMADGMPGHGSNRVAIGTNMETLAMGENAVAIGGGKAEGDYTVAIGRYAYTQSSDAFAVGQDDAIAPDMGDESRRRIVGVKDPTRPHDAATKNYVDTEIAKIPTGTEVNNIAPLTVETAPATSSDNSIAIGNGAVSESTANTSQGIVIGTNSVCGVNGGVVIGHNSKCDDSNGVVIGNYVYGNRGVHIGTFAQVRPTRMPNITDAIGAYAEVPSTTGATDNYAVALGSYSVAGEGGVVSVGSGVTTLTLSDDMTEEQKAIARAAADVPTRRIVNVTDPQNAQDAATKNYVDTQLTPINAKLQYVPENTNQILSQIETNAEKAQSAAEAAQTTAESKANQSDLTALQTTVAQQAETIAQLQTTITQLQSQLNNLTLEVEEI